MRIKRVALQEHFITNLLTHGAIHDFSVTEGVPEGAEFVRAYINQPVCNGGHTFWVVYQHPSFDEVPDGAVIPELMVEFREASG